MVRELAPASGRQGLDAKWLGELSKYRNYTTLLIEARQCRSHKARLVIAKLDRLSRNLAFVATLMESGVEFVAIRPTSSLFTFCAVKQRILRGGARYRAAWPHGIKASLFTH
jgi:hypothetical protein